MIHIPAGRDNIEKYEIPDYELVSKAPWWKKKYGWIIFPLVAHPLAFGLLGIWFSAWLKAGGLEKSDNFLFIARIPFTPSEEWRHSLPFFCIFFVFYGGFIWYLVALIAHELSWLCKRWQYRYELNEPAWRAYKRSLDSIKSRLLSEEEVLGYTRSSHRIIDEIRWVELGMMANVMVAAFSLEVVICIETLLNGPFFARHAILPWMCGLGAVVILIHVARGITLDSFAVTLFFSGEVCAICVLTQQMLAPVIAAWLTLPLILISLAEVVLLLRSPQFKLLVVTNHRLLIVTPRGFLRPASEIQAFSGNLILSADRGGSVTIRQRDSSPTHRASLAMVKAELPEFAMALQEAHPDWSVDVSRSRRRPFIDTLPRAKWLIAIACLLAVGNGLFVGTFIYRGLIVVRLLLPHVKQSLSGEPKTLYDNCKFVLSILPDEPAALSLGAYSAWQLDKLQEALTTGMLAVSLTEGKGKTGSLAMNIIAPTLTEQRLRREWEKSHHEATEFNREAALDIFLAKRLSSPKNNLEKMGIALTHAKRHLERALVLDPRTAPEVKRLRETIDKKIAKLRKKTEP